MKFITSATESTEIGIVIESDAGETAFFPIYAILRNPRINGINYRLAEDVKVHVGDIIGFCHPTMDRDVPAISVNGKLHLLKKV